MSEDYERARMSPEARQYRDAREMARSSYVRVSAFNRVSQTPKLTNYRNTILYDGNWDHGSEHWEWVVSAPVEEIVAWAEIMRAAQVKERQYHGGEGG